MINHITVSSELKDVYFEDIDAPVSSKKECYEILAFYYYYFSTLEAAKQKAKELGISDELNNSLKSTEPTNQTI